jgi:hypothetical protein
MKNSFQALESAFEMKFEAQPIIESAMLHSMTTTNVFGQMAELYIPFAAGAAVKMSTGTAPNQQAHGQQAFGHSMPEFDWRYKVAAEAMLQPSDPRDRFKPFLPF